jgi:hypothetical protein
MISSDLASRFFWSIFRKSGHRFSAENAINALSAPSIIDHRSPGAINSTGRSVAGAAAHRRRVSRETRDATSRRLAR